MSDVEKTAFKLVPELALLDPLPEHLRKRFVNALQVMHEDLAEHKSWEQIANDSAISPYHFHRQFSELFNETPGHYLNRLRLQVAVNLLLSDGEWHVIDIAQYCGFSSSQALGKALKRELGLTAKQIRKMGHASTPRETGDFITKLAHPGVQQTIEDKLAGEMPTELIWYPQRGVKKIHLDDPDWDAVFNLYGKKSTRLLGATPIHHLDRQWQAIETCIGDWQVGKALYDFTIPEGNYLCAEVYLKSDIAYSAALDALFAIAKQQVLKIDQQGYLVEMVRDIEMTSTGGVVLSFQLPVV
ncbi:AraC family transcriptional regulator [Photobacterium aquae]|uniref:AraC family transcriptional regulator n=1 Tax=Photobacterium aquae TaxID=1195763 RepID=A0A0J1JSK3_9GAMM|nr:AraC family transcriptional regulator [Photobacterium aquae]KLV05242.1 AraC family transcriptional regulator [Photobacterium aquae]